jgi:hypothetical protein
MSKKTISITLFAVVVIIGLFVIFTSATSLSIKPKPDGTYSLVQTYTVPEGNKESINISLVIKDGLVSSIKNSGNATNSESARYQSRFEFAIKDAIIGKKIETLNLSSVGGASLTTNAFNKSLAAI